LIELKANGITMRAVLEGPARAPVVTLSHSLAASLDMWRPQVPALVGRFRVLRYDVRGHGESEAPAPPYTLQELANDVHALLSKLGIERTHFVGLSMGGMIGQQLAVDHPDLLGSLVLADTLSAYPPEAMAMWQGRIDAASGPSGMEPLVEPTITRWFTDPFVRAEPVTIDWIRSMIRSTAPAGFIGCCQALMQLNVTERLRNVNVPTQIIVGREDPTTPMSGAETIRDAIPGARLMVIEDAAHISNVEQPQAFNDTLIGFLTEQAFR
jgi:3-oxoadipate enol-lactonase